MSEPIFLMIGGEKVELPPIMNFATLKRAWPAINAFGGTRDGVEQCACAIRVVSFALVKTRPDLTPEVIEERLRVRLDDEATNERAILFRGYRDLLIASGLVKTEDPLGEAAPAPDGQTALANDPAPATSTGTSTPSSPSWRRR
jgi:hypothetical protein